MKIYYAKIGVLEKEFLRLRALEVLPPCRLQKLSRMKTEESQKQCIAAGLLLEYGLQEYGICGKEVTFLENSDGKPYILEKPELFYNLSHSGEYVALGMSSFPIGIDIEKLRYGQEKLAKRFFSEEEAGIFKECFSDSVFTKIWTRKEAFIKARGVGMRMPLNAFSTITDVIQINEKMPVEMRLENTALYVKSYQINDEYWLSVCQESIEVDGVPKEINLEDLW